jgi:hypothetical protein
MESFEPEETDYLELLSLNRRIRIGKAIPARERKLNQPLKLLA